MFAYILFICVDSYNYKICDGNTTFEAMYLSCMYRPFNKEEYIYIRGCKDVFSNKYKSSQCQGSSLVILRWKWCVMKWYTVLWHMTRGSSATKQCNSTLCSPYLHFQYLLECFRAAVSKQFDIIIHKYNRGFMWRHHNLKNQERNRGMVTCVHVHVFAFQLSNTRQDEINQGINTDYHISETL